MKPHEPIWWVPLLRRVLRWGATSALLVILPVLLVVLPSVLLIGANESNTAMQSIAAVLYTSGLLSLGAFVVGAFSGLCAPASEPKNPLRSRFFGQVAGETFVFFVGLSCAGAPMVGIVLVFLEEVARLPLPREEMLSNMAVTLVFSLSLSLAISRALRAAKAK